MVLSRIIVNRFIIILFLLSITRYHLITLICYSLLFELLSVKVLGATRKWLEGGGSMEEGGEKRERRKGEEKKRRTHPRETRLLPRDQSRRPRPVIIITTILFARLR